MAKDTVRYSEAFKMMVISELESGKLSSIYAARRKYGIAGACTIKLWLKKYGKNHLNSKVIRVETVQDVDEKQALKRRIAELEKALADTTVRSVMDRAYFEVLCERQGITDVEGFKKKLAAKLSAKLGK